MRKQSEKGSRSKEAARSNIPSKWERRKRREMSGDRVESCRLSSLYTVSANGRSPKKRAISRGAAHIRAGAYSMWGNEARSPACSGVPGPLMLRSIAPPSTFEHNTETDLDSDYYSTRRSSGTKLNIVRAMSDVSPAPPYCFSFSRAKLSGTNCCVATPSANTFPATAAHGTPGDALI